MKYKVGDQVRIREWADMKKEFGLTSWGFIACSKGFVSGMKGYCGTIQVIESVHSDFYSLKGCSCWQFSDDMLEPVSSPSIVITTDGKITLAHLFEGTKVIKSATAKCNPEDTFDFAVGAKLAYDRLMGEEKKLACDKPTLKIGTRVRCINTFCNIDLKGKTGTVVVIHHNSIGVEFDEAFPEGHDCDGAGRMGHCRWGSADALEIITDERLACKFKVGDSIIGNAKASEHYNITDEGWIGTVTKIIDATTVRVKGRDGIFEVQTACFDLCEYFTGKLVCTKNSSGRGFTVGKVYSFINGYTTDDRGNERPMIGPLKDATDYNGDIFEFIPFVE